MTSDALRAAKLEKALRDLLAVIAADDLIPESVSYMRQARAALADLPRDGDGTVNMLACVARGLEPYASELAPDINCPACGETVKTEASATQTLALWQHWNWTCPKRAHAGDAEAQGWQHPVAAEYFICPECGPRVPVDEDGCCRMCGADCAVAAAAPPQGGQ